MRLKLRRTLRVLRATPPVAMVVMAAFGVGVGWLLWHEFSRTPDRWVVWVLFAVVLGWVHGRRRDDRFCRLVTPRVRIFFAVEYLICAAPFVALSLVARTPINAGFYLLTPVAVALMPTGGGRLLLRRLPRWLDPRSLELISFVRRRWIPLFLLIALATVLSFLPVVSIVLLLGVILLFSDAYTENERRDMLFAPELGTGRFLRRKIAAGTLFYLRLAAVAIALYAIFNPRTAFLALVPLVVAPVGITLYVVVKYSLYDPARSGINTPLAVGLAATGLIFPLLLPIPLAMAWRYYYSARENLNRYLNVYDQ